MGRIQSNVGLASGINITSTVDQLMAVSSRSKTSLETRVKGLQAQQVAINEITALVVGIQLQSDRIGAASSFTTNAVSSSKSDIVSAAISVLSRQPNKESFLKMHPIARLGDDNAVLGIDDIVGDL